MSSSGAPPPSAGSAGQTFRAKRELDEARKSGILPPEKDSVTGELINPHIPAFMAQAPWYLSQGGAPTLAHQRKEEAARSGFETFYRRGEFTGQAAAFRAGACRNCGSATHKERDCVERPRAVGAWKSGRDIAPDEAMPSGHASDWDAKRDRWAGYQVEQHDETIERYNAVEEERKRVRAEAKAKELADAMAAKAARKVARVERRALAAAATAAGAASAAAAAPAEGEGGAAAPAEGEGGVAAPASRRPRDNDDAATASQAGSGSDTGGGDSDTDTDYSSDGSRGSDADLRERDNAAAQATIAAAGTQKKMTVRNLRVREDTAKYLYNLDVNSAFYDPKTRSMRENPFADRAASDAPAGVVYRGDAALKASGGASEFVADQLFAWDAAAAGTAEGVGMQATPTQLALLKAQFEERKAALAAAKAQRLRAQYGEAAGVEAIPIELRRGQGEGYVEFTRDGRPVLPGAASGPGPTAAQARSRFPEDVWPGNHTSVFGSWFDASRGTWGFQCCHATLANAFCTGAAGKAARQDAERFAASAAAAAASSSGAAASSVGGAAGSAGAPPPRSSLYGEQLNPTLDAAKLRAALARYDEGEAAEGEAAAGAGGGRKRGYNSLRADRDVDEMAPEDIEAWQLKRSRGGDPMAGLSSDVLIGEEEEEEEEGGAGVGAQERGGGTG